MKQYIILLIIGITACASSELNTKKQKPSIMNDIKAGRDIIIKGETISESLDLVSLLHQVPLNNLARYVTVQSNIYFQDCTFEKDVIASKRTASGEASTQFRGSVAFINCSFSSEVDFRSSVFHGPVDFSQSIFHHGSNFQDAIFMQRSTFNRSVWKDEGKFQQARFYHTASFMDSRARAHMMFQKAVFRDDSNFNVTDYSQYVDFSLVRFEGKSTFHYAKWLDRAVLTNCIWRDDVSFLDGVFGSISFKGSRSEGTFLLQGEKISDAYIPMD